MTRSNQVTEEELVARVPLLLFTPVICYNLSAVKSSALQDLRKLRANFLQHIDGTLRQLCCGTLADMRSKLRWLTQEPSTPHELHDRQVFCNSLHDVLADHRQFVSAVDSYADVLQQFNCAMDNETAAAFYNSVYLPKVIVDTVEELKPVLQQLERKFVQEHQQELAGFLADLQQTEADIRQFHSYSNIDGTETYVECLSRDVQALIQLHFCDIPLRYADSIRNLQVLGLLYSLSSTAFR